MGQDVKNHIDCQSKNGLSDSSVKVKKFLTRATQKQNMCIFLGLKVKYDICDGRPLHLHTKCSLYECTNVQRSKIFKQNLNILIRSIFIDF